MRPALNRESLNLALEKKSMATPPGLQGETWSDSERKWKRSSGHKNGRKTRKEMKRKREKDMKGNGRNGSWSKN